MGFGRGKVILLGEHAVVYGVPALAAGIERGVQATATPADTSRLTIEPWGLDVYADPLCREPLARAFNAALEQRTNRCAVVVNAQVSLPAGAGLGCSAAIGVAVIDALDAYDGVSRPREELGRAALAWEKVFHGNPSGIDNAMAACGGVAVYIRDQPLDRLELTRPLKLVIANSQEPSSTKEMVESVARQYERDKDRIGQTFDAIAALVKNAKLATREGDILALGQLMDMNHTLLSSLMLCTTKLDAMCTAARSAGASGAKLTGAGGGGCIVALVQDDETSQTVLDVLKGFDQDAFATEIRP